MPVIKFWCLPVEGESRLRRLHKQVVNAVVSVPDLGLRDENDMTCLFPPDQMQYGLGSKVVVEVTGLFAKPERTTTVRTILAKHIGEVLQKFYPAAKVEVFVSVFDQSQGVFWTTEASQSD